MSLENEIKKIKKRLEGYDSRIEEIENLIKKKPKKIISKKVTITEQFLELKSEGFFDEPKTRNEIVGRLAQNGYHYEPDSLNSPLQKATRGKILGRVKKGKTWAYCRR